jgi:6-phosphogluconolactonase
VKIIHAKHFVEEAVALICESAADAISQRGQFRLGLCGGNTPRPIYSQMATQDLPWAKVVFTFGDERCVPPEDDQSNYKMAAQSLFDFVAIPRQNIHRMRGEIDPDAAAEEYESELNRIAAESSEQRYVHDLLLLGVGDDGHIASLFPGTAALGEMQRNVAANFIPKFSAHRLTLTYPIINAARQVAFLVRDDSKKKVVSSILNGSSDLPAAQVKPAGELIWFLGF